MTDAHFTLRETGLRFSRTWRPDLQRYEWTSEDCRVVAWGEVVEHANGSVRKVYRATVDGEPISHTQHDLRSAMSAGARGAA
jgi:hypothetical protein